MTKVIANLCWMIPGGIGGSEEYTVRLLRAIAASPPTDFCVELAASPAVAVAHPDLAEAFSTHTFGGPVGVRPYRVAVESTWLRRRTDEDDVVHHFGGRLPARRSGRPLVTIHDLQPLDLPENFSRTKRAYLAAVLPRSVRAAHFVCAVSDWVAERIVDRFALDPERIRVVPSTWDTLADPDAGDPVVASLDDRPVIFYPAVTHPHKDHATLIRAARRLAERHAGIQLVLSGASGAAEDDVRRLMAAESPGLSIVRTGRVAASSVAALLRRADVMAFPSRYEGFGLPVLEAMRLGTPVVAAAATALPEVAGPAALLPSPGALDDWVDALDSVLSDSAVRARLVEEGHRRSAAYAPGVAADRLVSVWREATP